MNRRGPSEGEPSPAVRRVAPTSTEREIVELARSSEIVPSAAACLSGDAECARVSGDTCFERDPDGYAALPRLSTITARSSSKRVICNATSKAIAHFAGKARQTSNPSSYLSACRTLKRGRTPAGQMLHSSGKGLSRLSTSLCRRCREKSSSPSLSPSSSYARSTAANSQLKISPMEFVYLMWRPYRLSTRYSLCLVFSTDEQQALLPHVIRKVAAIPKRTVQHSNCEQPTFGIGCH